MRNTIFLLLLLVAGCQKKDALENFPRPVVETLPVTNITATTASLNGNVVSDGGVAVTSKGFYYTNDKEPSKMIPYISFTNTGTKYRCYVEELTPGTVYTIQAWVHNGLFLIAGNTVTFKTLNQ